MDFLREISTLTGDKEKEGSVTTLVFDSKLSSEFSKESLLLDVEIELLRSMQLNFDSYAKDPVFSYIDGEPGSKVLFLRKFFNGNFHSHDSLIGASGKCRIPGSSYCI